ncbi:putative aldouronate transport system substrate-binding protein [Paenibacillus sp. UNCCL117]|uniref:ABC transporter substrate-binding protein n=1 Tax=unclassified Paenibacillus TaxID=185978 RepID=UPI00088A8FA0|nr:MULTISPECIES: ABC transporter substrate-binding protein [unclassified Paenibacillus]SDD41667.1 carbohydrate ABC transporter substrate-binding protein, CUT1 family [Paenibacillus sp. cl123]SFW47782.1 putative aldouronate transport system substrate-binding protein [Paenibacillus sp. UNCCL117]
MKQWHDSSKLTWGFVLSVALVLSGCSTDSAKQPDTAPAGQAPEASDIFTPVGQYPIVTKPMTIKMFAPQLARLENMETNLFTKYLQDKTNIQIKWDLVPEKALNDRKQLMLASGDYPEVILHGALTKEEQMKYGKQGVFIPLNDLIDKYAPNFKKAMADLPYLKSSITSPDGNIYALPQINECYHCNYAQKLWINQSWLDKLGLKMPTTTEEFYKVLLAFKENDPNGNGKKDEIPLTGSDDMWAGNVTAFLMNAFIIDDQVDKDSGTFLQLKDGKVDFVANKAEWKEGLLYLNKLFKEGLIDPASFTQNSDAIQQLGNRQDANVIGAITTALISYAHSPDDKHPRHKEYVAMPPLKGPNGVQQAGYFAGVGNSQMAITNKATKEQQIAAIRLADYLYTEEAIVLEERGLEGQGWRKAKEGELDMNGKPAKYAIIPDDQNRTTYNDRWEQIGPSLRTYQYRDSWAAIQDPLAEGAYEVRLKRESAKYEPFQSKQNYPSSVFIALEDAQSAAQLKTSIRDYVKSNMAQFITGSKDIEKEWDSYVKGFEGLRLSKYVEIYQKAVAKK